MAKPRVAHATPAPVVLRPALDDGRPRPAQQAARRRRERRAHRRGRGVHGRRPGEPCVPRADPPQRDDVRQGRGAVRLLHLRHASLRQRRDRIGRRRPGRAAAGGHARRRASTRCGPGGPAAPIGRSPTGPASCARRSGSTSPRRARPVRDRLAGVDRRRRRATAGCATGRAGGSASASASTLPWRWRVPVTPGRQSGRAASGSSSRGDGASARCSTVRTPSRQRTSVTTVRCARSGSSRNGKATHQSRHLGEDP